MECVCNCLVGGQAAVGMELPGGEDQSDQVDEGSDPAVGGRLQQRHAKYCDSGDSEFNANWRISYLEEGRVRSSVELVGVGVMGLNGQVLHQSHTVDVEEHSHQGLEGRKGRAGTLMGRVIRE